MRSTTLVRLLFTLLAASSILAVFPMPMPGGESGKIPGQAKEVLLAKGRTPLPSAPPAGWPFGESSEQTAEPSLEQTDSPMPLEQTDESRTAPEGTLISRMNVPLGDEPADEHIKKRLSRAIFNEGLGDRNIRTRKPHYTGRYKPDTIGPNPKTAWIYLTLIKYKRDTLGCTLDCTEKTPCKVWLAQGDRHGTRTVTGVKRGRKKLLHDTVQKMNADSRKRLVLKTWPLDSGRGTGYAGIGQGLPPWDKNSKKVCGRPVGKTGEEPFVTVARQKEWDRLLDEFNARFAEKDFNPVEYAKTVKEKEKASSQITTHWQAPS